MNQQHIPVLAEEVTKLLQPNAAEHYLDLTAGYGGHARRILEVIGSSGHATLVDRDNNAIQQLQATFQEDANVQIVHSDYLNASQKMHLKGQQFDMILADIGLSSPHIDNAKRGFSFSLDGPLDMRMDSRSELTAADIVNTWDREEIIVLFQMYGEIHSAPRITDAIIAARPLSTTTQLADVINTNTRGYPKVRLEAQIFQALRIAVNQELAQLADSLPIWHSLLKPGGRLAVISFHSLEDRIVKHYFAEHGRNAYDADLEVLTKQPARATPHEIVYNPRARSAKLRVVQRK